jgi:hypothetical protein
MHGATIKVPSAVFEYIGSVQLLDPKNQANTILTNVGNCLPVATV